MAEYKVVLDGIDLDPEKHEDLQKRIRQAALTVLAEVDTRGDQVAVAFPGGHTPGLVATNDLSSPVERLQGIVADGFAG